MRLAAINLLFAAAAVSAKWTPGTVDASDKPLVVVYHDEWAKWSQYFSVYQLERMILSRQMEVRNWVVNYSFLTWSAETCRLVPTDHEVAWSSPDTQMFPGTSWWDAGNEWGTPAGQLPTMIALKQKYPYIKLLFSVGGWSMSHTFSDCIRSNPVNMIESAKDFVYYFDFDGIDLDWEYPECPLDTESGDGSSAKCGCQLEATCYKPEKGEITHNKAQVGDWEVYMQFVKNLREAFDDLEDKMQKKLYVTAAIGMNPKHIDGDGDTWKAGMPVEWICDNDYFDWVNLMTYDFYGPWTPKTGHLAPLRKSTAENADEVQISIDESMQKILARCSRPEKLTMGLAAYGKGWSNVPPTGTIPGLWQTSAHQHPEVVAANKTYGPALTYEQGTITYWDVKYNYLSDPLCKRTFDNEAMAPTLHCTRIARAQFPGQEDLAENVFITYEDGESWKAKMAYAREKGMAGAIIWAASNSGHEAQGGVATHDGVADLYGGLLEGWYGSPKNVGGIGANGAYTFTPVKGNELPNAAPCPYGYGKSWRKRDFVSNPCYDEGSHPDYQATRFPKKSGAGAQDMVGKDVIIISKSGSAPSTVSPVTTAIVTTAAATTATSSSSKNPNPNCTLPPECYAPEPESTNAPEPEIATSTAAAATTTSTSTTSSTTSTTAEAGEQSCKEGPWAAAWVDACAGYCDLYSPGEAWCAGVPTLVDCVYNQHPFCRP